MKMHNGSERLLQHVQQKQMVLHEHPDHVYIDAYIFIIPACSKETHCFMIIGATGDGVKILQFALDDCHKEKSVGG